MTHNWEVRANENAISGDNILRHWQSGGKNAIKNAKQDSPFEIFFRIMWNVESHDKREKLFSMPHAFDKGHGGKNVFSPLSRLKNF